MFSSSYPKDFSLLRCLLLESIIFYQKTLSFEHGLLGKVVPWRICRFRPTCSTYAFLVIWRWGIGRGAWLALKRLLKCHPWTAGGFDPPP